MLKKLFMTVLGVVVMLTWWTIRGSHAPPEEVVESIPAKVWDGGGGTLSIDLDTNVAGKLSIGFDGEKERSMTAIEKAAPGTHSWTVEVPRGSGGYIEFNAEAPQPGAKMSWTLRHDGRLIASQTETLDRPLQNNEAFFLQEYFDDYSQPDVRVADSDGDSDDED